MFNAMISRGWFDRQQPTADGLPDREHADLEALQGDAALLHRARELNTLRDALSTPTDPPTPR
ncbi:MAG TPA: hypothetical protein VKA76_08805 [Gammaproteobacteria bacterium]|nr:hypothetical protein [Gammaproteobacteria bacterium]